MSAIHALTAIVALASISFAACSAPRSDDATEQTTQSASELDGGESVVWTNLRNATATGDDLAKTGGIHQVEDSGGISQQQIGSSGGSVEFSVSETAKFRWLGVAASGSAPILSSALEFAFRLQAGRADVYENGAWRADNTVVSGARLGITITSSSVRYYENGVLLYQSAKAPRFPLVVAASLIDSSSAVNDVQIGGASTSTPRSALDWGKILVDGLVSANNANNVYGDGHEVWWKDADHAVYKNDTVCSTLLSILLRKGLGMSDDQFKAWWGGGHLFPTSSMYHDRIVAQDGFLRISAVNQIQPGDIVAVKYSEPDAPSTGHTAIVARPVSSRAADDPFVPGTEQWDVPVLDSSASWHGRDDTRYLHDGGGAGIGSMRLYANPTTHAILGYTWSWLGGSTYYPTSGSRHVVIGRYDASN